MTTTTPLRPFTFENLMNRPFSEEPTIRSISFPISRFGLHIKTIGFIKPVNEEDALKAVLAYLNQPLTQEHWSLVRDDISYWAYSWERIERMFQTRGSLLCSYRFLRDIVGSAGEAHLIIFCPCCDGGPCRLERWLPRNKRRLTPTEASGSPPMSRSITPTSGSITPWPVIMD
jgi:hypothetical protein